MNHPFVVEFAIQNSRKMLKLKNKQKMIKWPYIVHIQIILNHFDYSTSNSFSYTSSSWGKITGGLYSSSLGFDIFRIGS